MKELRQRRGFYLRCQRSRGEATIPIPQELLFIATFGTGVVISCSQHRLEWVKANLGSHTRDDIFNPSVISMMGNYVSPDNQTMAETDLKSICTDDTFQKLKPVQGVDIKVIEGEDIQTLYPDTRFRNSIGDAYNPKRPTVAVVTAASGGEMYQVGIDVIPGYRNKGLGSTLVSIITQSILEMGKVPYYSTWANNIASRRLAISVGYLPAWVEVYARDKT